MGPKCIANTILITCLVFCVLHFSESNLFTTTVLLHYLFVRFFPLYVCNIQQTKNKKKQKTKKKKKKKKKKQKKNNMTMNTKKRRNIEKITRRECKLQNRLSKMQMS